MDPKWLRSFISTITVAIFTGMSANVNGQSSYQQNFENYAVGSTASDSFYAIWGGWQVATEGGNNFFRSVPYTGSDYFLSTSQQFSGNTSIEFMSRNIGTNQLDLSLTSSFIENMSNPGSWSVNFWANPISYGVSSNWINESGIFYQSSSTLGQFQSTRDWSNWHDMKVTLDGSLANFYIDGSFLGKYDAGQVIPVPIQNFNLSWMTWGQRDLDNIVITPVPEPETYMMMLAGLGLLGFVAGRRKRSEAIA